MRRVSGERLKPVYRQTYAQVWIVHGRVKSLSSNARRRLDGVNLVAKSRLREFGKLWLGEARIRKALSHVALHRG